MLPCLVCGKPVEKDAWFLIASQAQETIRTGSKTLDVPQRPVHVTCLAPFPLRCPNG